MTTGGGTTWGPGSRYQWEINDAAGVPGGPDGWDVWDVAGTLFVTAGATPNSRFTIEITGPDAGNTPGLPANFSSTQSYRWTIATAATDIAGFDPARFARDTSHFVAPGIFSLVREGNAVVLSFTPVPESGYALAVCGAVTMFGIWRWRPARRDRYGVLVDDDHCAVA